MLKPWARDTLIGSIGQSAHSTSYISHTRGEHQAQARPTQPLPTVPPKKIMNLTLSHDSPINTSISNSSGQVLYRAQTPLKWYGRVTRIYKVVPNDIKDDPEDMEDRFEEVARIEWRGPKTSIFRYRGRESLTKDFFRHHGVSGRSVGRHPPLGQLILTT